VIALDTNIDLRYALKDDTEQTRLATDFLRDNECLLLPTVVLEAAWVMGSKRGYALDRATVAVRLRHVAGLPNVRVEQATQIAVALRWYEAGMDIADPCIWRLPAAGRGW
jgi:Predicted nucleic-acid-binding protein, contains PIN domain